MNRGIPEPTPEQAALMERAQQALNAKQANAGRAKAKAARHRDTGGNRRRWRALNAFCDLPKKEHGLRPGDALLWLVMFRHADREDVVTLSQTRMQECTGLSRRAVSYALQRLIQAGHLERLKRGGPNSGLAAFRMCKGCTK